jgi:hypothetical protein
VPDGKCFVFDHLPAIDEIKLDNTPSVWSIWRTWITTVAPRFFYPRSSAFIRGSNFWLRRTVEKSGACRKPTQNPTPNPGAKPKAQTPFPVQKRGSFWYFWGTFGFFAPSTIKLDGLRE